MTTTERSESMNAYFDCYVNSNTMLNEFVVQYDKTVTACRAAEEREDFQTMNTQASLSRIHPIERTAGAAYTRRVFRKFQVEFVVSNNCTRETLSKTTSGGLYQVGLVEEDKQRRKVVEYSSTCSIDVRCGCSMFETLGILCKHALCMLKKKKVLELSQQYILPRWTLSVSLPLEV